MTPAAAAHLFTAAVVLLWFGIAELVPPYLLPSPIAVARQMMALVTDAAYLRHGLASVLHVVSALLAAFVLGLGLAALAHYVPITRLLIHGRVNRFMNSFSALGWTFLAIIWFGVNDFTVVFAMTAVLLPLIVINLREGFLQLDSEILEMGRSFGRNPIRYAGKLVLPMLVPFMLATLRICYGVAWIISLTIELFGGNAGYGYLLNRARMEFKIDMIFAIILLIILIVFCSDRYLISPLQARLRRQLHVAA